MNPTVETAFDGIAEHYDSAVRANGILRWMREKVWCLSQPYLTTPSRVLELGAGTCQDAEHFAPQGHRWLATDISSRMLGQFHENLEASNGRGQIKTRQVDFNELDRDNAGILGPPFDVVFSNLGALNCCRNLRQLSTFSHEVLVPGGLVIAVVMSRCCLWETLYFGARGEIKEARRRRAQKMQSVRVGQQAIATRYYSPQEFASFFASEFDVVNIVGLGVFVPPPYLNSAVQRHPFAFKVLTWMEARSASWPILRSVGDHFFVILRKSGNDG